MQTKRNLKQHALTSMQTRNQKWKTWRYPSPVLRWSIIIQAKETNRREKENKRAQLHQVRCWAHL